MEQPGWFDLALYPPSKDPEYWAGQILARLAIESLMDFHLAQNREASLEELFVDALFNYPMKFGPEASGNVFHMLNSEMDLARGMTMRDAQRFVNWVESNEDISQHLKNLTPPEGNDGLEDYILEIKAPISKFQESNDLIFITDVTLDDDTIIGRLKHELEARREEIKESDPGVQFDKKKNWKKVFADWWTHGVLPKHDLELWAQWTQQKLTNNEISRMIWPDGSGDAERVRKTTSVHQARMLSRRTLMRLISLISPNSEKS